MRIAICSDIHGNRQGFEAVIAAAEADGADELWCLGDLVGYGAEPDACVELAARHCSIVLAGNHDLAVVEVLSLEEFSRGASLAAQWTRDVISDDTRQFLLSLKPEGSGEGYGLFHASPRDPIWEYVLSALAAELCFDATEFKVSFIGHSHVALSFHRPEGEPATGTTRREGAEVDVSTGHWRGLAAARHECQDRHVAAGRVRHRGRPGGHPGGQPAGLAGRAPPVRPVGGEARRRSR
jgi:predicted phosphodiesterase